MIVDDHPIIRTGLRRLIELETDMVVCGEAEGVKDAIAKFEALSPDVALLDLSLLDGEGWEVIRYVREHWVGVKIIVVTSWDRMNAQSAIDAGAMGFVSKYGASDMIIKAIRCVLDGKICIAG